MKLVITGGIYKGRYITVPQQRFLRPVTTMIRESLFNIIEVENMDFLDLFAGTGIMGIEAISRGADVSYFVEKNYLLVKRLKENLIKLNINEKKWEVIKKDLRKPSDIPSSTDEKSNRQFDIIYADPPFVFNIGVKLKKWIIKHLKNGGIFILRRYKKSEEDFGSMETLDVRKYGDSKLYVYKKS